MKLKHYMLQLNGPIGYAHVWAEDYKKDDELLWHVFKINSYMIAHFWQCDVIKVIEDNTLTIDFYVLNEETLRA